MAFIPAAPPRPPRNTGREIFGNNAYFLEQLQLRRPIAILTAICTFAMAVFAVTVACEGVSHIPKLCLFGNTVPAVAWGIRYLMRKPVTYIESLLWVVYCDMAIVVGIYEVGDTALSFVKLAWLVAINTYVLVFHGRRMILVQSAVTGLGAGLILHGAQQRMDCPTSTLIAALVTVLIGNLIAGWAVSAAKTRFSHYRDGREHLVRHDHLTGLLNRRGLQEACDTWPRPLDNKFVTVVVIDLNEFKAVNDTYGHHVGDEVLHRTAQRLQTVAGLDTMLARLGGDEFALVAIALPPVHLGFPRMVWEALAAGSEFPAITASIGASCVALPPMYTPYSPSLTTVVHHLLVEADADMYRAKRQTARMRDAHGRHAVRHQVPAGS